MSFPVRKLLINNFKSFGKAIIEFERYTVFVTFGEKCVGLIDIIETLQFVLCHNYKLKPKDIRKLTTPGMAKPERTFVKVQVFEDNISYTFERAVNDNAFEYLYNDVEVTLEIYMTRLSDLGLTDCTATMFVNLDVLNTYVSFTDKDRCRMIETLCGSINEKPLFDKLNNKLQMNKKELNIVMQRHKYLTAQRNELKKRKVLTQKLNSTKRIYEDTRLEFYHFKLFHNKNAVTDLEFKITETQNQYDALLIQSFDTSNQISEIEKRIYALCNELRGSRNTLQLGVQMRKKFTLNSVVQTQMEKLKEDVSDINYVIGLNNVRHIENTIKILEDRLKKIEDDKNIWGTAFNSLNLLKYSKLQMDFEDKFPETVVKSSFSTDEMELITVEIDRYNEILVKQINVMKNLQCLKRTLDGQLSSSKEHARKIDLNRNEIQILTKLIEDLTRNIENTMLSKKIKIYDNIFGIKSNQLENTLNILKSNNPGVYGRVSDFTRSTNAFLHDALKCRFGSSYQAIVVDTKETAHDCISLMKKLKLTEHNETFLFLSGLKLQDTEKFMIDKEGVKHIQFEYIENVLSNITDSIKDALFSCASKTVFCKSYDDAVKVFDLEKNNVNVVSTDDQLLFERSGFITKGSKESEFEISDAIFNDFRIKKLEAEEKLRVLLSEQTKSKTMIMSLISLTEKKLINIIEEIDNASKEVDIIDETIDTLTDKLTALKNQEGNHPTAEDEFFADFCKYLKIPNIKEYRQRMLNPTAAWSTVLDGINDRLYDYKKELDIKQRNNSMFESLRGSLNFFSVSLSMEKGNNSSLIETLNYTKLKNKENLTKKVLMGALKKDEANIYKQLMEKHCKLNELSLQIEQRLRENYEILLDCKKNMIPIDRLIISGSLNDILYLPEDSSTHDLMRIRLERIDVNFDYMSNQLKNVELNEEEETCKMLKENLNEIEAQLKLFPPPETNTSERINFYNNKLIESIDAVKVIKDIVDEDELEFLSVKEVRMEKFLDCLNELNVLVLENYVQLKLNSTSTAFFSIVNEVEPFKDGVKLTFWNNPSMQIGEDESFLQALAVILSIITYKKQIFVIFADLAKFLQPDTIHIYQNFFSFEKEYQLVFFTSRPEFQDNSHYTILQKIPMNSLSGCIIQSSFIQRTIRSSVYSNKH